VVFQEKNVLVADVSVVIPTHNRLQDLNRSLASVYKQKRLPIEIIVVDDGSTLPVSTNIFDRGPASINYVLLRNDISKGANCARNRGIDAATGKYIAFLDDDDIWASKKLDLQFEVMESKQLDLCYSGKQIVTFDVYHDELLRRYSFAVPKFNDMRKSIMHQNFIGTTSSIMVKKSSLIGVGGFDVAMPALQDYELYIRLIFSGYKIAGVSAPLLDYSIYKEKSAISKSLRKGITATKLLLVKHRNKDYFCNLIWSQVIVILKKTVLRLRAYL